MSNRFHPTAALIPCALLAIAVAPASAENARRLFGAAMERYEKRVASIESVTIVQEVMGVESTTRLRKEMIEDRPVLVPSSDGEADDFGSMYYHFDSMAKNATVKGTEVVDEQPCWVIHVTELGGINVAAEASDDFEATDGTLHLDKKELVVRRMQMNGVTTRKGVKTPVSMEMHLRDYREIDGWLHPFQTVVSLGGAGGAEAPEMAEMREAMAKMKEELAQMPAEQRQMMEEMMKERMPGLENMAESGSLEVTVTVKEIRVNEPAR